MTPLISILLLAAAALLGIDERARLRQRAAGARLAALHAPETLSEAAAGTPAIDRLIGGLPLGFASLGVARRHVWIAAIGLAAGASLALRHGGVAGLAGFLVLGLIIIQRILRILGRRQLGRFLDVLPAFVDRLRQLVVAGNSPASAFGKCLAYGTPLERLVFGPAAAVMAHGAALPDALASRAQKLDITELFLFAAIIRANARYGGDLYAILGHFEDNLVNRLRAQKEFAALTAEVGMTANILMGLPVFTLFGIFSVKADYFRYFLDTPGGHIALLYVGLSLGIGYMIVRRMARIAY